MRHAILIGLGAMAAGLAMGVPAVRADVTPQDAQALQTRLRDWVASTLPPGAPPPEHPIEVSAAGDHLLILAKGLGKPDGAALVWNVVWQNRKLLVNGTDVSAMIPK